MQPCATCRAMGWNFNEAGDCRSCVRDQREAEVTLRSGTRTPETEDRGVDGFIPLETSPPVSLDKFYRRPTGRSRGWGTW